jgi:4-hydroxybenzoate polyprenyltransferase
MSWVDAIRLGRVSNLPTVWTNALAGIVLAGGALRPAELILLFAAVSLAYVGGMFLNDAFDAEIDSRQRPDRPIPAGRVTRQAVITAGSAMLAGSVLGLGLIGFATGTGLWAGLAGTVLAGLILFYDWHHKANPLSPVVMGLCRVMVYVAAGVCVTHPLPASLWIGAALLLCHLIGLTYAAKQENLADPGNLWPLVFLAAPLVYGLALLADRPAVALFWVALAASVLASLAFLRRRGPGDIPRAVATLIAAISLLDALLIAGHGRAGLAIIAAGGFLLTLFLQRFVRGT